MLCKSEECCGCGACYNVCPQNCIEMTKDSEGFSYPIINNETCINCGMCEKVCPIINTVDISSVTEVYAAKNKSSLLREHSSSGAVFPSLARWILDHHGYVCGAVYDDTFTVVHRISDKKEDIQKMCGAKYSQSDSWECFKNIKTFLSLGKLVLFVGTPCQTLGLKKYLGKEYQNLVTVDMICHGVPSPKVWKKYVQERNIVDAPEVELIDIQLRNKDSGWSKYNYSVKFEYENKMEYKVNQQEDKFIKGFTSNLFLRPSCSHCIFKGIERASDITLGDFWGIWNINPEFDDDRGVSLIMVHSEKGRLMWNNIKRDFESFSVDIHKAVEQNPSALIPSKEHDKREYFFQNIDASDNVIKLITECLYQPYKEISIVERLKHMILNWR